MNARKKFSLREILDAHRGERHVIVLQDYPDPDAIASAYTHKLLAKEFDIETDILYASSISHQQNLALVRLLDIELDHYDPKMDLSSYNAAVFIDNQGTTAQSILEALEAAGVPVLLVVDHHDLQGQLTAEYSDIQRIGATASMYTDYLQEILELDRQNKDHVIAATALMHGILTDTGQFLQAKTEDFHAAGYLIQFVDIQILKQILSQARSRQTMEVIQRALGNRITVEGYSIAQVGYLRSEDRDAIPQAADFLLTEENMHTSIVYGIIEEEQSEKLAGSVRTLKITLDIDDFIKDTFGKTLGGKYYGGGKDFAGAFEIPVGFLAGEQDEEYKRLKWEVFDRQVRKKILNKIGVSEPPSNESG